LPSIAVLPAQHVPGPEARLEFIEHLTSCDEAGSCAEAAVAWLARHTRVSQVLCLLASSSDPHRLHVSASHGLAGACGFYLPLHDSTHPLVQVLHQGEPAWLSPAQVPAELPLSHVGVCAFPLVSPGGPECQPQGLLLSASSEPTPDPELGWLAARLGRHLALLNKARQLQQLEAASRELTVRVNAATEELAAQNDKLRHQAIELEQASAAKSQFLANMSHELRTPLNAILGYTNMLLQGVSGDLAPAQRRSLSRIDSNGRHLLEIINEILDITRIEAGRMPIHYSDFRLTELIQEVMAELDPIIVRSKLLVSTVLDPALPELYSDRQKVKQIIVNLLSNSLKFTHEGSIQVIAAYDPLNELVNIAVEDTGIGIDPVHQEKIFEDFQQVDSSPTRAYGGTGLGLSICRRLAAMLEGGITLRSAPGQGSTFTLHIPRRSGQS
jgi:signal transduction histidine kinase